MIVRKNLKRIYEKIFFFRESEMQAEEIDKKPFVRVLLIFTILVFLKRNAGCSALDL